jgi:hypothetical protein
MGEMKSIQQFSWEPARKIRLGGRRRRWEDNIKIDLTGAVFGGVDWIHLAKWQDLVNTVMYIRFP